MKKLTLLLALFCFAMAPAFASTITGNIGFTGSTILNTTSVNTATQVTAWSGAAVGTTGLIGTTSGDLVAFASPWSFNSGAITDFWHVDGYQFNLTSSTIVMQGGGFLDVTGIGTLTKSGYADTVYTWHFSSQDPSTIGPTTFTFSASANPVPEPASLALLSAGLICLGGLVRRRK